MRWILCGKGDVAVAALERMRAAGDEVWVVGGAGDDGRDGWQRSLRGAAERAGVRFDQPARINHAAFVEALADFGATALVSIQYEQILKGPLLQAIACPALNLHFSLLPRHRGVAPIAWAILSGDAEAGATLHHMRVEIDAGDVIAQRRVPIRPDDTARDLYDRVSGAAARLFEESFPFPEELLRGRRVQDSARACYHRAGDIDFSRRAVDWNRPAERVQRWLRMMIFPPLQLPEAELGGRCYRIERVAGDLGAPTSAAPGEVLARTDEGLEVAAGDRCVRITRLHDAARPQRGAAAALRSIAVGERFASAGEAAA